MNPVLRNSATFLLTIIFSFVSLMSGCQSSPSTQAATPQNANQSAAQNPSVQQMSVDDMVAPIALYPTNCWHKS